jgi:diaminohydroxyphosphoribosylaminopyrimidine deaminase/5-amino-6-(5-phosphoribosylamino)uracil reductase
VVIGESDPNPRVKGGGAAWLASRGLEVETGVLEPACRELTRFFRKYITTGLPFVTIKSAATLDGRTATQSGQSRWVTG